MTHECEDWTSRDPDDVGLAGDQGWSLKSNAEWTRVATAATCAAPRRLYCFQQD